MRGSVVVEQGRRILTASSMLSIDVKRARQLFMKKLWPKKLWPERPYEPKDLNFIELCQAHRPGMSWHELTINEQVPNGAVPDAVLPFKITHKDAMTKIREFAGKRRIFADRAFVRGFKPENVVGVYMPYMVVDANASADLMSACTRPAR